MIGTTMGYHETFQGGAYRQGLTDGYLTAINEAWYIPILKGNEAFGPYWYTMAFLS